MNKQSKDEAICVPTGFSLCSTHPAWEYTKQAQKELWAKCEEKDREIRARGEILNAIAANIGEGNCWMNAADLDWRLRLRGFAEDGEQHQFDRREWTQLQNDVGITLFADADYFTAYYDHATELWERGDDDHPMFHVMVKSDPPHRCCFHAMHLAAWVQLLTSVHMPVQIFSMEALREG